MKFQGWDLRLFRILCSTLTILANEVKIFLFSLRFRDTMTGTMLPNVAFFACYAMRAVILKRVSIV